VLKLVVSLTQNATSVRAIVSKYSCRKIAGFTYLTDRAHRLSTVKFIEVIAQFRKRNLFLAPATEVSGYRSLRQRNVLYDLAACAGIMFLQERDDLNTRRVRQRLGEYR
jgi:hypothetical protein